MLYLLSQSERECPVKGTLEWTPKGWVCDLPPGKYDIDLSFGAVVNPLAKPQLRIEAAEAAAKLPHKIKPVYTEATKANVRDIIRKLGLA